MEDFSCSPHRNKVLPDYHQDLLILLPSITGVYHWVVHQFRFLWNIAYLRTHPGLSIQNTHIFHLLKVVFRFGVWKKYYPHQAPSGHSNLA